MSFRSIGALSCREGFLHTGTAQAYAAILGTKGDTRWFQWPAVRSLAHRSRTVCDIRHCQVGQPPLGPPQNPAVQGTLFLLTSSGGLVPLSAFPSVSPSARPSWRPSSTGPSWLSRSVPLSSFPLLAAVLPFPSSRTSRNHSSSSQAPHSLGSTSVLKSPCLFALQMFTTCQFPGSVTQCSCVLGSGLSIFTSISSANP